MYSLKTQQDNVSVFCHEKFGQIRTVLLDGNPWFVAKDVCDVLNTTNPSVAIAGLENFERAKFNLGRQGEANIISESGFYTLVLRSRKPMAKRRKLIDLSIEGVLNDMDLSDRDFRKVIKEDYEEVFSEEETDKMMEYLQSNLDVKNLGILLIFVTGLRVGELVALKHEDFNGNIIKIRRTEVRYADGHGKHEYCVKEFPKTEAGVRSAIIPADFTWLADRLKLLNPFGEYVFTDNGKRLTTNTIRRRLTRLCQKLNIYAKSPHKIRKTYGSILIDNNLDARLITDLMGHTNISTTEQHYHRNRKTMIKKAQIIANIPEFQAK